MNTANTYVNIMTDYEDKTAGSLNHQMHCIFMHITYFISILVNLSTRKIFLITETDMIDLS